MKSRTQGAAVFFLLAFLLVGCSASSAIVGTWTDNDGTEYIFFEDGALGAKNGGRTATGTYSVSNNQLILEIDGERELVDYKIDGNTLTMTARGQTFVMIKSGAQDTADGNKYNKNADSDESKWYHARGENGASVYKDKNGEVALQLQVNYIGFGRFSEGLVAVRLGNKWGFIDKKGKEVVSCKYDDARDFSESFARIELDGKWGFVDVKGKEVIPCKYDYIPLDGFSDGKAYVMLDGEWFYIDKKGNVVD